MTKAKNGWTLEVPAVMPEGVFTTDGADDEGEERTLEVPAVMPEGVFTNT